MQRTSKIGAQAVLALLIVSTATTLRPSGQGWIRDLGRCSTGI
jgi:hypothetical protein